jgi:hypothetical protein
MRNLAKANARSADFTEQLRTGKYALPTRPKAAISPELEKARRDANFLRARIQARIQAQAPKNLMVRAVDMTRAFKLSGLNVFAKLGGATGWNIPVEALADLFGAGAGQLRVGGQKLASVAEREGRFSPKAEGKGLLGLVSRSAVKNAVDTIKHGFNELDVLAGNDFHGGRGLVDTPGRLHGATKSFLQTATFEKSLVIRTERAARQGLDITNPDVQAKIGFEAAKEAQNAKLQGDNALAKGINNALGTFDRSPSQGIQVLGALFRTLVPIVKVPANYVGKAIDMTGVGLVRGAALHGAAQLRAMRGEPLTPEVADSIGRAYKYGGLGLVTAYIGLTQPAWFKSAGFFAKNTAGNKDSEGKPMQPSEMEIKGHKVPHLLAHSAFNEAVQFWATIRRALDQTKETDPLARAGIGGAQALTGLAEQAPGLQGLTEAGQALTGDRPLGTFAGTYLRNQVVPQIVQQGAQAMDKDAQGNVIPRAGRGFKEAFGQGVPGLRRTVATKEQAKAEAEAKAKAARSDPNAKFESQMNRLMKGPKMPSGLPR